MKRGFIAGILATLLIATGVGCSAIAPEPDPSTPTAIPPDSPGIGPACPTANCFTVAATGDMLIHSALWKPAAIETNSLGQNFDFVPLLQGQSVYLNQADIAVCQQDAPLTQIGELPAGYPIFNTPWELAVAEKAVGYDACTTAGSHTLDMGYSGVVRTLDVLDENGLKHTGS